MSDVNSSTGGVSPWAVVGFIVVVIIALLLIFAIFYNKPPPPPQSAYKVLSKDKQADAKPQIELVNIESGDTITEPLISDAIPFTGSDLNDRNPVIMTGSDIGDIGDLKDVLGPIDTGETVARKPLASLKPIRINSGTSNFSSSSSSSDRSSNSFGTTETSESRSDTL